MSPTLPSALRAELSPDLFTEDPAELAEYGRDWTRVYPPSPCAVAFPRTTEEVVQIVKACARHGVAVVPSGGRTGLAGGALAKNGELVLSLARMRRMDPVDHLGQTVRVQAGAVTEAVHQHVQALGLTWPVDFASKGSSTVGGNIATNAGGVKVIRYGLTRQWVLGLQVVLASGEVLELGGALEKNNTGADLRQLFIGSEGTLGIVTEATLKLQRLPGPAQVMLFAVQDLAEVLHLFREARHGPFEITAYEFFTQVCLERVQRHRALRSPLAQASSHYVLLEVERAVPEAIDPWMAALIESGCIRDGVVAASAAQAQELWALREGISESLSATGLPHKNDIALPVAALEAFCADLERLLAARYPDLEVALFGHIGDGNLHVNVMKPDALDKEAFFARTKSLDPEMFALVQHHRGSISAEHGIGVLKKPYLHFSRSPAELEVLRTLKRALDPQGLLNPGKIIDV